MTLIVRFDGKQAGPKFKRAVGENRSLFARAITGAARDVSALIIKNGRANMRAAGDFDSKRWQDGLHADVIPKHGAITNPRITVFHDVPYFMIFETGGVIKGRPLLWIPLSYTGIKKRARDYGGGLFRVDRKRDGLPLLLSSADGQAKYFGKKQVRIPKKFTIGKISAEAARKMPELYELQVRKLNKG